jgi:PEP-CTERM motif
MLVLRSERGRIVSKSRTTQKYVIAFLLATLAGSHAQIVLNGGFESNLISSDTPGGTLFQGEQISGWQIEKGGDLFLVSAPSKEHGLGASTNSSLWESIDGGAFQSLNSKDSDQYVANLLSSDGSDLPNSIIYQSIDGFKAKSDYSLNYSIADYYADDKYAALLGVYVYNTSGDLLASTVESIEGKVGFADESLNGNIFTGWENRSLIFQPDANSVIIKFDFGHEAYLGYPAIDLINGPKAGGKFYYTAGLDNVFITSPSVIPEPSTLALLGTFGGFAALRRRRCN